MWRTTSTSATTTAVPVGGKAYLPDKLALVRSWLALIVLVGVYVAQVALPGR